MVESVCFIIIISVRIQNMSLFFFLCQLNLKGLHFLCAAQCCWYYCQHSALFYVCVVCFLCVHKRERQRMRLCRHVCVVLSDIKYNISPQPVVSGPLPWDSRCRFPLQQLIPLISSSSLVELVLISEISCCGVRLEWKQAQGSSHGTGLATARFEGTLVAHVCIYVARHRCSMKRRELCQNDIIRGVGSPIVCCFSVSVQLGRLHFHSPIRPYRSQRHGSVSKHNISLFPLALTAQQAWSLISSDL